jgi:hypothetical protein
MIERCVSVVAFIAANILRVAVAWASLAALQTKKSRTAAWRGLLSMLGRSPLLTPGLIPGNLRVSLSVAESQAPSGVDYEIR